MKIKFNRFERIAGLFLLVAILGTVFSAVSVAIKQGWFESKYYYTTSFENADGVHPGTAVVMAGLRAGSVDQIELEGNNKIRINFYVMGNFAERLRKDSKAILIRPFIIGDRVLEVSVGDEKLPKLAQNDLVNSDETVDLMTLISGKKLGTSLTKIEELGENIETLLEQFLDKSRTQAMVRVFDRLDPFLTNMNTMSTEVIKLSRQATADQNLKEVLSEVHTLTSEMNKMLPEITRENPEIAKNMGQMTKNFAQMSQDLKAMTMAIKDFGPEIPGAAQKALEALNEAVVVMKAMEKSFFLKSNVQEVKEEEQVAEKSKKKKAVTPAAEDPARQPANDSNK